MPQGTSSSVTVAITGPSETAIPVGNTTLQGNNVFRRTLAFGGVVPADSGEYTCSVVVGGVTESISAVLDGSGKSGCCINVGISPSTVPKDTESPPFGMYFYEGSYPPAQTYLGPPP